MRKILEELALRSAYWILSKVRGENHTEFFNERIDDVQREIAEVVTTYYNR